MSVPLNFRYGLIGSCTAAAIFLANVSAAAPQIQGTPQAPAAPQRAPVTPPPVAAPDTALEVAKQAFDSLTESDRIALQDGLIWTGDYNGIAAGKFGKATRDAIVAFAGRNKLPTDGTLDAKGRGALAAAAKQAKEAVRFMVQIDETTGARIGLPLKLVAKTKPSPTGTRYSSADESFSVETTTSDMALQDAYAATIASAPGRKLTYKVSRPDFFVVTGEIGAKAFYTRIALGQRAGHAALNGFTITYPLAEKSRFDPITIAIANSFVPFPDAAVRPTTAQNQGAVSAPNAATADDPGAAKPVLTANGVIVGPGLVLTSLPKTCAEPLVQSKKAKMTKQSDADGLTLLSLTGTLAAAVSIQPTDPANQAAVTVLSFTTKSTGTATSNESLIAVSGDLHKVEATGGWRLLASIQAPAAGAAVLDRGGALVGLIPIDPKPVTLIAGIYPQMSRAVIPASKMTAFLGGLAPKPVEETAPRTTGEVVAMGGAAMVSIYCAR